MLMLLRKITSGKKMNMMVNSFNLKGFSLLTKPIREKIPIYLGCSKSKNGRINMGNWRWGYFIFDH